MDKTGLFSGANLVTSVDVGQDVLAVITRVPSSVAEEIGQIIKDAATAADPWPCVVDEAHEGDPNKKLIRFGRDYYVLDVQQIEALPEMHFPFDL